MTETKILYCASCGSPLKPSDLISEGIFACPACGNTNVAKSITSQLDFEPEPPSVPEPTPEPEKPAVVEPENEDDPGDDMSNSPANGCLSSGLGILYLLALGFLLLSSAAAPTYGLVTLIYVFVFSLTGNFHDGISADDDAEFGDTVFTLSLVFTIGLGVFLTLGFTGFLVIDGIIGAVLGFVSMVLALLPGVLLHH